MANPTDQLTAWQKATFEATLAYAQASLASAEQLLKLNLDAARNSLEQSSKTAHELLSTQDPQDLVKLREKIAKANMQQSATYAQSVYDIVSQSQANLTKLAEEQYSRINHDLTTGAEKLGKGAPGSDIAAASMKSTLAATNAMMESLNQATKQFAELSQASIKAATSGMFNPGSKK